MKYSQLSQEERHRLIKDLKGIAISGGDMHSIFTRINPMCIVVDQNTWALSAESLPVIFLEFIAKAR